MTDSKYTNAQLALKKSYGEIKETDPDYPDYVKEVEEAMASSKTHEMLLKACNELINNTFPDDPEEWDPRMLPFMSNATTIQKLISHYGEEKVIKANKAKDIDSDKEYGYELKEIPLGSNGVQKTLFMSCPSTDHTHAISVPDEITSAREGAKFMNHGVDPSLFDIQT